jgi:hypothetical protein
MQSRQSAAIGYNTLGNGDYLVANLTFDPTLGFHEYRIDFVSGNVFFFADSVQIGTMNTSAVPTSPGHIVLRHWSNGNTGWTSGPPTSDAIMLVSYVKSYFNSTDQARQSAASLRCSDPTEAGATCAIPDHVVTGNPMSSWFFANEPNMTNNQTVFGKSDGVLLISVLAQSVLPMFLLCLLMAVFI